MWSKGLSDCVKWRWGIHQLHQLNLMKLEWHSIWPIPWKDEKHRNMILAGCSLLAYSDAVWKSPSSRGCNRPLPTKTSPSGSLWVQHATSRPGAVFPSGMPQEIHLQQVDWNVLCTWKVLSNYGKSQNPFSFPCRRGMILPVQLLVSNSSCHPMESKRARSTYNCIPFGVVEHGWWEIPN